MYLEVLKKVEHNICFDSLLAASTLTWIRERLIHILWPPVTKYRWLKGLLSI